MLVCCSEEVTLPQIYINGFTDGEVAIKIRNRANRGPGNSFNSKRISLVATQRFPENLVE